MYPASTTKILTAILAIENCDLSEIVTVKNSSIQSIPDGYSTAYLVDGEELSIDELLQVLLVHSANDAAVVLADHISGSVANFSNLMNTKATEIGCKNTHFVNPNGMHSDDHYTTPYDLSLIANYCMQNSAFRKYVSMSKCTIKATNKSAARQYSSTNELLKSSSKYYIENCIGIKTGTTTQAGNCLVSEFSKDALELICVVLGSETNGQNGDGRYIDTKTLYDYGYSNYSIKTIAQKGDTVGNTEIANGKKESKNLNLILQEDLVALTNVNEEITNPNISLIDNLKAPISQNQKVGTATYTVNDETYTINLLASHDVEVNYFWIIILGIALIIIILILLTLIRNKNKKKKKKRKNKYYENY